MTKTHAKEYLIEFANSLTDKDWLKCLILEAINTNGNISEDRFNAIYDNLSKNSSLEMPVIQVGSNVSDSISLVSLKHISGINALKDNQTIKFSNNVTILHGMNGAGKSSYFRILNEITGGNQQKDIKSNIYQDTPEPIKVELKYIINNSQEKTINWTGTPRALTPLNKCSVFDSSYLEGFLSVRTVNEALIQPLGLGLFSYIANMIDRLKAKLVEDADKAKRGKPTIDCSGFLDDLKSGYMANSIIGNIRKRVESSYHFSEDDKKRLDGITEDLEKLKLTNSTDKIALLQKTQKGYSTFKNEIESVYQTLTKEIPLADGLLKEFHLKQKANEDAKKRFAIFSSIPESDSKEWKQFIQAGHEYHSKIKDNSVCPYCRQTLDTKESRDLLCAYATYLTDNIESELVKAKKAIEEKILELEKTSVQVTINEDVEKLFESVVLCSVPAKQYIIQTINEFGFIKKKLLEQLKALSKKEDGFQLPVVKPFIDRIDAEIKKQNDELAILSKSPDTKKTEIETLEPQRKLLMEKEAISKQSNALRIWFQQDDLEKKLTSIDRKISTKEITQMANVANDELLTENLKTKFIEELTALGKSNLQVSLTKVKGTKGKQSTQLILTGQNDVRSILSEGEQKAIGLALFIAEIRSSQSQNPIVLDDPVNSLDHQIAGHFAERLLCLDNQIVVFNHNALFLNAFETSKENHVCKSGDSACCNSRGKHIKIYQVQDEGKNAKGVVIDYMQNKAKDRVREANRLLNKSPFNEHLYTASVIRRAVECCIDEVVFKNQCPTKFSTKNSRINWDALKTLVTDNDTIEKLRCIHDRVSGSEIHNGVEAEENPLTVEELRGFVNDIESILNNC